MIKVVYHETERYVRVNFEEQGILMRAFEEIDIHSMNKVQAQAAIDAVLKKNKGEVYTLKVIHGYHGGTSLRDFVRTHYKNNGKVKRIELGLNPGETDLILRDLY